LGFDGISTKRENVYNTFTVRAIHSYELLLSLQRERIAFNKHRQVDVSLRAAAIASNIDRAATQLVAEFRSKSGARGISRQARWSAFVEIERSGKEEKTPSG
jgi:hypothetical protein